MLHNVDFNEKVFLRKARLKSILRTTLVSLAITLCIFALLFVIPEIMLQNQENRIDSFYPDLVKFSQPNTYAIPGESYNIRLFGRQKKYYLLRFIGNKPYPAGIITVDFDAWGGEQTKGNNSFYVNESLNAYPELSTVIPEGAKKYLVPYAVPKLEFYHPAIKQEKIIREFDVLEKIPNDNLVEMAVSFKKPLTLDEIKAAIPGNLKLMWGAVSVFEDKEYEKNSYLSDRLVGNPYLGSPDGEEKFIKELERLSNIPSYHSKNLKRTLEYLKENDIKYYGAVVVGSPKDLIKLSSNELITGAVLGIVSR
ncbi:anti-sigma factor [Thermovorax subterraneus]|nr:anti-sigma factor [Thermovorax subterraneus]